VPKPRILLSIVAILAFVLADLLGLTAPTARAESVVQGDGSTRPRVALVLSGGGARGLAHIGVLRVLRELRVPVDLVVGTSMGAVVAGAFAAGRTPDELVQLLENTDWDRVLADRPPRDELSFRRREEDVLLPSRLEFGLGAAGLRLPPATAGNSALQRALERLLPDGSHDLPSNRLALPFRSVASDLVTGELVELRDTPLLQALRASLSMPGVFAPVRVQGRLLVDGGLVRNLPVDLARSMGADVVIAVNVGTPLAGEETLGTSLGAAQQMLSILTEQNVQRSLRELRDGDILIAPTLKDLGFLDFRLGARAVQAGELAARAALARLQALAVSPQAYAAAEALRVATAQPVADLLPLAAVVIEGTRRINAAVLQQQTTLRAGQAVSAAEARDAAARLYGRGDLQQVQTDIQDRDGERTVTFKVIEAGWAQSRLRVGLELNSDFSDDNNFAVAAMYVASSLNRWGAELRASARIGSRRRADLEWWQPLGAGSPWYAATTLEHLSGSFEAFEGGLRVARLQSRTTQLALAAGRQLGDWGDLRVGHARVLGSTRVLVPEQAGPRGAFSLNAWFARLTVDTLDNLSFPTRGTLVNAEWSRPVSINGELLPDRVDRYVLAALRAFGRSDYAGHVYGEWARSTQGAAPLSLGGFLRLSGTTQGSVFDDKLVLARVVLARRIGELPLPFGGRIRVGFSLETGGAQGNSAVWRLPALKQAGSVFISADTRFGPVYLGAGGTRGGNGAVYLFLGPIW